jgi:mono/diheme cytochrome c family protein
MIFLKSSLEIARMHPKWLNDFAAGQLVESGEFSARMGCAMSSRILFALWVVVLWAGHAWAQEQKKPEEAAPSQPGATAPAPAPTYNLTPEDVARKNPVKRTQVSVDRGKKLYLTQCALCHGAKGDGKGELVEEMKINPPDLTKPDPPTKRTDGEWFAIISQGGGAMPGQGARMKDREKWDLVNFLRSFGGKSVEKSSGNEPEENVILVPQ